MPITASPEQLLDLLEAPYWKTPGSTSRKTEGRTARRTEGAAAVNLTVVDHIRAGRQVLATAKRIEAEGTPLALRKAAALRQAQALKSLALMGERTDVRRIPCPYCGAHGLMLTKAGRAVCINRHCAAAGVQRSWGLVELLMAAPARPSGVRRSVTRPRDDRDPAVIVRFLANTAYPISLDRFHRLARMYDLPSWASRTAKNPRTRAYSLSDVLTVHAIETAKRNPSDCAAAPKPACDGLADAFFKANDDSKDNVIVGLQANEAKALCHGCPFLDPCLAAALAEADEAQHGVRGGLNAKERRELKTATQTPTAHVLKGRQPDRRYRTEKRSS
ncbi:WhiB family transcriptional regulator [[Kitasatospora] papulosa]